MATCKYSFIAVRRLNGSMGGSAGGPAVATTSNPQHAPTPQTRTRPSSLSQQPSLSKETINVTKMPSGLVVASMENNSPVFRVAAVVAAGARHEPYNSRGVTTFLRIFGNMSTRYISSLGLTKNLERIGANFKVSQTREQMIYSIEGLRTDFTKASQFLVPTVCYPMFKPHEIHDHRHRVHIDYDLYKQSPELVLNDLLHQAAFRGGLSRPLGLTEEMIERLTHRHMYKFHARYYQPNTLSIVASGCNHQELLHIADRFRFSHDDCLSTPGFGNLKMIDEEPEPSKYKGGELRHDKQESIVHIALACEGVSSKDEKAVVSSGILSQLMGSGPSIKWSAGLNRLQKAAEGVAEHPCMVSSFNFHYTESGLFGVHIICHKEDGGKVVKAVWSEFSKVLKNGVTKDDFNTARKKYQVSLMLEAEQQSSIFNTMLREPSEADRITDIQSIVQNIESGQDQTAESIGALAKKMLSGKPTMVAYGNLQNVPYLDELRT